MPIKFLKSLGVDTRKAYQSLSAASLRAAVREQGLQDLVVKLRDIVPDLRDQFTTEFDEAEYLRYWELKMRGIHAWQMQCVLDAVDKIDKSNLVIADIGDSSGTHARYLKGLDTGNRIDRTVSINIDPVAVEKIRRKGGEAILSRVEELDVNQLDVDLYLSFEMIEHLTDPIRFLHGLATQGHSDFLFMTVPYRRQSRFGGAHMRLPQDDLPDTFTPEEVHMFEFSPEDWSLLVRFSGYRIVFTRTYFQYPRYSPMRMISPLWRRYDFEGFLGFFLERDTGLAKRYSGW